MDVGLFYFADAGAATELTDGEGGRVEVVTYPRPVRGDLPIWLTSAGNVETFRLAGELRAGVLTHLLGQDIDDLAGKIREYRRALAARPDADGWPGHVVIMLHTFVGDTTDEVRALVREPFCEYLASSFTLFAGASGLVGTVDDARHGRQAAGDRRRRGGLPDRLRGRPGSCPREPARLADLISPARVAGR